MSACTSWGVWSRIAVDTEERETPSHTDGRKANNQEPSCCWQGKEKRDASNGPTPHSRRLVSTAPFPILTTTATQFYTVITIASPYVLNSAAKTPVTARLHWLLVSRGMEFIPDGQPVAADTKLSTNSIGCASFLGENPRKEQTVVIIGNGVRKWTPTPL